MVELCWMICLLPMRTYRTGEKIPTCRCQLYRKYLTLSPDSMNRRAPGPVPVTPTEAATIATASASQAQTVCKPQTQCPPVTSAFVPLSAGGYSLPSTSSTPRTSTLHHSGQAVFSSCHGLPMPTLSLPIRGCMGYGDVWGHSLLCIRLPPHPPLLSRGWLGFRTPRYLRGWPLLEMGGDRQTSRWFQSNQNPFKCEKRQNTHKQPCTGRAAERLSDCLPKL